MRLTWAEIHPDWSEDIEDYLFYTSADNVTTRRSHRRSQPLPDHGMK
jgi:hypothetical protein